MLDFPANPDAPESWDDPVDEADPISEAEAKRLWALQPEAEWSTARLEANMDKVTAKLHAKLASDYVAPHRTEKQIKLFMQSVAPHIRQMIADAWLRRANAEAYKAFKRDGVDLFDPSHRDYEKRGAFLIATRAAELREHEIGFDPISVVTRAFRAQGVYAPLLTLDLPERVQLVTEAFEVTHYNRFGEEIFVQKRKKSREVTRVEQVKMPAFPPQFAPAVPSSLSKSEKHARAEMFIHLYSTYGYVKPAAIAVGMTYTDLIGVIAEDETLKAKLQIAEVECGLILDDMAAMMAHGGDTGMIRFLITRRDVRTTKGSNGAVMTTGNQSAHQTTMDTLARLHKNEADARKDPLTLEAKIVDVSNVTKALESNSTEPLELELIAAHAVDTTETFVNKSAEPDQWFDANQLLDDAERPDLSGLGVLIGRP